MTSGGPDAFPTVTVAIPVLDEEQYLKACLDAINAQEHANVVEILVVDGGSTDRTREIASSSPRVTVLDNPRRIRPAGLNVAIAAAQGEIFVRVDGRTEIAPDYVARCVAALEHTRAAVVGGPMRYAASGPVQRGIAAAMTSRLGAGPAAFRRVRRGAGFVDTVYLGTFRTEMIRRLGGYDEWFGGNEDAELNHRCRDAGGVWLDPEIRSSYAVREGLRALFKQFRRYGRARATTIRKHPRSLSIRQLAVPALVVGLASPWRRKVLAAYVSIVFARGAAEARRDLPASPAFAVALPVMHAAWAVGFAEGVLRQAPQATAPLPHLFTQSDETAIASEKDGAAGDSSPPVSDSDMQRQMDREADGA
jgi:glycosyltransferase involved in cell wall biosynthesis